MAGTPAAPRGFPMLDLPNALQALILEPMYTRWMWGSTSPEHARLRDAVIRSTALFAHLQDCLPPHPILRAPSLLWPTFAYCRAARQAESRELLAWARANGCPCPGDIRAAVEELALPDGMAVVRERVLGWVPTQDELSLPRGVAGAFEDFVSLARVGLPDSLVHLGQHTFEGCTSLLELDLSRTAVVRLGEACLRGCARLERVALPDGMVSIGRGALERCAALPSIRLPASLVLVQPSAFAGCLALQSVALPEGLRRLGVRGESAFDGLGVFQDCAALTSAVFPASLRELGVLAFARCARLERAHLQPCTALRHVPDYAFYRCARLDQVTFPAGLRRIGSYAFSGSGLRAVRITGTALVSLGVAALADCESLRSVELPRGLTHLGADTGALPAGVARRGVFQRCRRLNSVALPESLAELGAAPFAQCGSLPELLLGHTRVTRLRASALRRCAELALVTLPEGLTHIGAGAFEKCGRLPHAGPAGALRLPGVALPRSLAELGERAFAECTSLARAELRHTQLRRLRAFTFFGCRELVTVFLPDELTHIGVESFSRCSRLDRVGRPGVHEGVELPRSLVELGGSAFLGCTSLTTVDLRHTQLVRLGDGAFGDCRRLAHVSLPASLTALGGACFAACSSLIQVDLRHTRVRELHGGTFAGCAQLLLVHLPEELTGVHRGAFQHCTRLTLFRLPDGLLQLGAEAFAGCANLERVSLPAGLEGIGSDVWGGCGELREVAVRGGGMRAEVLKAIHAQIPVECVVRESAGGW